MSDEMCLDGFHSTECPGCGMTAEERDGQRPIAIVKINGNATAKQVAALREQLAALAQQGVTLTREPGLRAALDTIREICKPMSMTMQGPRWMSGDSDVFGGGNRERVWRIADAALASEDRP